MAKRKRKSLGSYNKKLHSILMKMSGDVRRKIRTASRDKCELLVMDMLECTETLGNFTKVFDGLARAAHERRVKLF